jgi:hypothetical protein
MTPSSGMTFRESVLTPSSGMTFRESVLTPSSGMTFRGSVLTQSSGMTFRESVWLHLQGWHFGRAYDSIFRDDISGERIDSIFRADISGERIDSIFRAKPGPCDASCLTLKMEAIHCSESYYLSTNRHDITSRKTWIFINSAREPQISQRRRFITILSILRIRLSSARGTTDPVRP